VEPRDGGRWRYDRRCFVGGRRYPFPAVVLLQIVVVVVPDDWVASTERGGYAMLLLLLLKMVMVVLLLLLVLLMLVFLLVLLVSPGKRLDGLYGWWDLLIGLEPVCDTFGDRVSQVDRMFATRATSG
jgi:hypothetical protein